MTEDEFIHRYVRADSAAGMQAPERLGLGPNWEGNQLDVTQQSWFELLNSMEGKFDCLDHFFGKKHLWLGFRDSHHICNGRFTRTKVLLDLCMNQSWFNIDVNNAYGIRNQLQQINLGDGFHINGYGRLVGKIAHQDVGKIMGYLNAELQNVMHNFDGCAGRYPSDYILPAQRNS